MFVNFINKKIMKYNIIQHITTSCNYNCTYCDVIKDWKNVSNTNLELLKKFIIENKNNINRFKFFWWEPLLRWNDIKNIIDNTKLYLWNKFEIVTNTTLLNDEVWLYFSKYFEIIFFSIDSENRFNYVKIFSFINTYNLKNKVYFNLIISPWEEDLAYDQFLKIYSEWYKNFNILPVYFTKKWSKLDLLKLSKVLKKIIDISIIDSWINLYWFQSNNWYNSSLINDSLFIDTDLIIYYSDFVSTFYWKNIKDDLFIWDLKNKFSMWNLILENKKSILLKFEWNLIDSIIWQRQLHLIMDYFSIYLNKKINGI